MRYRILGGLAVRDTEVTAGRDRVVLAMLLLHSGRGVGVDALVDAVWQERPPATARAQLHTCVSRLRRALPADNIRTVPAGYRLDVADDDLDALVYHRLVAAARAEPDPDSAAALLRQGLDLWRGPALGDIDSPAVHRLAAALDQHYATAVEDWVELELTVGGERVPPADLHRLVERFPTRERLRGQLIRSLYAGGRRADALAEYRRTRAALVDELGIEPGPELQALHRQMLAGELPAAPVPAGAAPIRCLPRAVGDFTGRTALLDRFRTQVDTAPPGPSVHVFDGMAGVGKTTLAIRLAELAVDRYPDAHLFIDLHGHSDREAVDHGAALSTLLRQLGVAANRIAGPIDQRTAQWRSELARRRTVLVLDNAATSAQVLPLLPGCGDHLTLVTSRHRLTGLDGVRTQPLAVLTEAEAADLFIRIVGERAVAEPVAVREVVRRCGLLPLAVRLAAARLSRRRRWRVADLLDRLGDTALAELTAEDRTVAAAFALSYNQLATPLQRLFRLLGLYPGERFDAPVAAALADLPRDDAEDLLAELADVNLVEEQDFATYRLHDLIRQYAATLAAADQPERQAALRRLFDHATHAAATVARPLESPYSLRTMELDPPLRPDLLPGGELDQRRWLDRNRCDHLSIVRLADATGATRCVWQLARAAWRMWYLAAEYDELIEAHRLGLAAARRDGDLRMTAVMANYLASGLFRTGRARKAVDLVQTAYENFSRLGDVNSANTCLANLATLRYLLGDIEGGYRAARRVLDHARACAEPEDMTNPLNTLGLAAARRGDLAESLDWFRRAMFLAGVAGVDAERYNTFGNVAATRMRMGHRPAERMLRLALSLNLRNGYKPAAAEAAGALGVLYRRQGRFADAIARHRTAIEVIDGLHDRQLAAQVHLEYGETLLAAGRRDAAAELFRRAAAHAAAAEAGHEQARSHAGLRALTEYPNGR
ncbi:BTAD domain-containing putative transcriptional regulator [Solwaraspora sp. WMMD1047]|uniref:AfsR/SARP family transcriptional regulator n=1 Tax=Solwaraspora sp. WMMD1047 TaxID=3016102 RepID=UPI0024162C58|nr:BTAD domain-containing putative transcriptional regulator [Solwaraspora sp. WMMD1047]MDG4830599.1 BTAD domain-containing putative transcriptional regulator [Solwaraspora sp. WMMD1047]